MAKTTKPTEAPTPPESFEASTERLATIVESLERGDLPLERALALFEEGVRLARDAQARIEGAEKRVEELLGFDAHGKPTTRPLPSPAASDDEVDAP